MNTQPPKNNKTRVDSSSSSSRLRCSNLTLRYSTSDEPVLDGVDINVRDGEMTSIVGPNGCGKTTLLRGLTGHLRPESGTVYLDGKNLQSLSRTQLARTMGYLPQEHRVPGSLTVEELVSRGRYAHRSFFSLESRQDRQQIEQAMETTGVYRWRDRPLASLSGGQKQLCWIALKLAQDPDVLVADEPTTFLDLNKQLSVLELLERLGEEFGLTILITLHDLNHALQHTDEVYVLRNGIVVEEGPPEQVLSPQLLREVFAVEAREWRNENTKWILPQSPVVTEHTFTRSQEKDG